MRRLLVGDRQVRVRDEGEGKRRPVVLIHGAGASSAVWIDVVKRLSPRRRVIAPDLPGHGQSDRWHDSPSLTIDGYRDAVGAICAHAKIERAILVGHSMGGAIALACALAWPERVAAVVLVCSAARFRVAPSIVEALAAGREPSREVIAELYFSPSTARELIDRWSPLVLAAPPETTAGDLRAVDGLDLRGQLSKIQLPALAIGGADDRMLPPKLTLEAAAGLGNARAAILPHAAHLAFQEQPDAFHAVLDPFLLEVA